MADTEGEDERSVKPPEQHENHDPKDDETPPRGKLDRQRSFSTASLVARTKLASLIQIASEAESDGKTDHKKVADKVFDSVGGVFVNNPLMKGKSSCMKLKELTCHETKAQLFN